MSNKINLGAIERKEDKRDFNLGAVQALVSIPDEFLPNNSWLARNYQGKTPSCGAHAASHLKAIQENLELKTSVRYSPRFSWIKIKETDGYALEVGTDMRSIFKSLTSYGVLDFPLLGNEVNLDLVEYSKPSAITQEMLDNAEPKIIKSYAFLGDTSMSTIKQAIYQNNVVILLLRVGTGFWGTQNPKDTSYPYGHFVVADGYTKDTIRIIDSAEPSEAFAVKFLDSTYLSHVVEAGTAVDLPNTVIPLLKSKISILRQIVELYTKILNIQRKVVGSTK